MIIIFSLIQNLFDKQYDIVDIYVGWKTNKQLIWSANNICTFNILCFLKLNSPYQPYYYFRSIAAEIPVYPSPNIKAVEGILIICLKRSKQ